MDKLSERTKSCNSNDLVHNQTAEYTSLYIVGNFP